MDEIILLGSVAVLITATLSVVSLQFKNRYCVFKEIVSDFAATTNLMVAIIEDDKITEDEFKDLTVHLKDLITKAQKLL